MKVLVLTLLFAGMAAYAQNPTRVPLTCTASPATVTAGQSETFTMKLGTLPASIPAAYFDVYAWHGHGFEPVPLNSKSSVAAADTNNLKTGTYIAGGLVKLIAAGQIVGEGYCSASFVVQ